MISKEAGDRMEARLQRIEEGLQRFANPKQLQRRWVLIESTAARTEVCSQDGGELAHELIHTLHRELELFDGEEGHITFEIVPAERFLHGI